MSVKPIQVIDDVPSVTAPLAGSPIQRTIAALLALVAAVAAVYCNSLRAPFIFDDYASIIQNPHIRGFWSALRETSDPDTVTVMGRPVLQVSLWANYALGGLDVRGYHAVNIAIHILSAWTLFDLIRVTLRSAVLRVRYGQVSNGLALAISLLWAVHPLHTESVTYVVQRAESLAGLFYLLTVYCFARGAGSARPGKWYALSVLACMLGIGTKEVLATAPIVVWLYDRTFASGSFGQALIRRKWYYLALACTWGAVGYVLAAGGDRGSSAGFGLGTKWWAYALSQFQVIVHYLRLSFWPNPLVLDYGAEVAKGAAQIVPYALVIALLAGATVLALQYWPALGFLGAWFFAILAPTSSVVPLLDIMFEHRMYLPLAAVAALVVAAADALWRDGSGRQRVSAIWPGLALALALIALGWRTLERNNEYRDAVALWESNLRHRPNNPRAHYNLGYALVEAGRPQEAIAPLKRALELAPGYADVHTTLGNALSQLGRSDEALQHYEQAARIEPDNAAAHYNLGNCLLAVGRYEEAIAQFNWALRLKQNYAEAHNNLGNVLSLTGRPQEAIEHYEKAIQFKADYPDAYNNCANALKALGRYQEAIDYYQRSIQLRADNPEAHNNLANTLRVLGRNQEAIMHYQKALHLRPEYAKAAFNLAQAYADDGQIVQAIAMAKKALELARSKGQTQLATQVESWLMEYKDRQ